MRERPDHVVFQSYRHWGTEGLEARVSTWVRLWGRGSRLVMLRERTMGMMMVDKRLRTERKEDGPRGDGQ